MNTGEIPVTFLCGDDRLYGIVHQSASPARRGVLVVPGRPAVRAGKHRLFVLLARAWADAGIPVMRFDLRGTGDCEGEMGTLDETSEDIASAIDAFTSSVPGLQEVVLLGLCGGAADAALYAPKDPRITGVVMMNPWSYDARVQALVKLRRFGGLRFRQLLDSIGRGQPAHKISRLDAASELTPPDADAPAAGQNAAVNRAYCSYREADVSRRLLSSLTEFKGRVLLIFSGGDSGAQAFKYAASLSWRWRRLLAQPRVTCHDLAEANHSLRRPEWRAQAEAWTREWLEAF